MDLRPYQSVFCDAFPGVAFAPYLVVKFDHALWRVDLLRRRLMKHARDNEGRIEVIEAIPSNARSFPSLASAIVWLGRKPDGAHRMVKMFERDHMRKRVADHFRKTLPDYRPGLLPVGDEFLFSHQRWGLGDMICWLDAYAERLWRAPDRRVRRAVRQYHRDRGLPEPRSVTDIPAGALGGFAGLGW